MEKRVTLLIVVLAFVSGLLLSPFTGVAQSEEMKWTFATNVGAAANAWVFHPSQRFQTELAKATGGRLVFDTKVDLFPPRDVVNAVIAGHIDAGAVRLPWVSGTFPLQAFPGLPFFFENVYEYENAINDPRMEEILEKAYAEVGLVRIMEVPNTPVDAIFANKPLKKVDDFKGLKIRTAGMLPTFTLKTMGASPITIPTMEIAQALQRGMVDAVQTSPGFGTILGLCDVTTNVSFWPVMPNFSGALVVNKEKWDKLPEDLKEIVLATGKKIQAQLFFSSHMEYYLIKKVLPSAGMKVTMPDQKQINQARKLAKPAIDKWLETAGPYGKQVLSIAAEYASGAKIMLD